MRVYCGQIDVQGVIEAGLAVRRIARRDADRLSMGDFICAAGEAYSDWTAEFIDTLLDYIEREQRFVRRFRSWRKAKCRLRAFGSSSSRIPFYMEYLDRAPDVVNGQWLIKGTRVQLRTILASLADGDTEEEIRSDFPALTHAAFLAVIAFAADAAVDVEPRSTKE